LQANNKNLGDSKMAARQDIEQGSEFAPKFDENGLITAVAQDAQTGFSRSRQKLWKKGQQSGHFQKVQQILIDCDQDCLVLKVTVDAGQCHAGYQSCFYRALDKKTKGKLKFIAEKVYDPQKTYKI